MSLALKPSQAVMQKWFDKWSSWKYEEYLQKHSWSSSFLVMLSAKRLQLLLRKDLNVVFRETFQYFQKTYSVKHR